MNTTSFSVQRLTALALGSVALTGCSLFAPPHGQGKNININGVYSGRLIDRDQNSKLLDVTVTEKDDVVTAQVTERQTGQTYTLTGTRSVYNSTPVVVNMTGDFGSGSCGGKGERYTAEITFPEYDRGSANGFMNYYVCQGGQWQQQAYGIRVELAPRR